MADGKVLPQECAEKEGKALLAAETGRMLFQGKEGDFSYDFRVLGSAEVGGFQVLATSDGNLHFFKFFRDDRPQYRGWALKSTLQVEPGWCALPPAVSRVLLAPVNVPNQGCFLAYVFGSGGSAQVGALAVGSGFVSLTGLPTGGLVGEDGKPYHIYRDSVSELRWCEHGEYQPPSLLIVEKSGKVHRFACVDPPKHRWWQKKGKSRWYAREI